MGLGRANCRGTLPVLWRQGSTQGKAPVPRVRWGRKGWRMTQSRRVVLKPPGPGTLGQGGSRILAKVPRHEQANGAEASAAFTKPERLGANAELLRWGEGRSARNFWGSSSVDRATLDRVAG